MIEQSIVHLPELVKDIDRPVSNYLVHLSRLSLAIVPRPCLGLVTVCKGPVRIRSRARLRRSGKNRRRQRRLLALQLLPRVQISSLLRLHLGLMEISTALLGLASWP